VVFIGCLRSVTNSSQPMLTGISSFFFKETAPNTLVDGVVASGMIRQAAFQIRGKQLSGCPLLSTVSVC
ncbi:MAG: hypothetical protein ACYDH9_14235, partial [Limisphaerales bacterium]